MRIVITGAAGYIGRHVVKQVLDMGHEVTAVDFRFDGVDARAARWQYSHLSIMRKISIANLESLTSASIWPGEMALFTIHRHTCVICPTTLPSATT